MESMLFLGKGPTVPTLARIPSSLSTPRETTPHFSRSHTCAYSLTSVNTCRPPIRHVFYPVIRALDGSSTPSRNCRNENKIMRAAVGASIALSCVLGIIVACVKMSPKAIAGPRELYQKAPQAVPAYPIGGKSALKSLLDVNVYLASSKLEPPGTPSRLPARPSAEEVNGIIKMEAIRLMKYGNPEDAVLFLRNAYNKYRYDLEPAYNVEMALVEILICQGKYMEASECNCIKDDQRILSDGRIPLYKAIIYTMLDDKEEAKKWWEKYVETVEGEFDPRSSKI
ncbi:hypothetical protein GH714_005158 [Hevea brasiliensis]|uniref:Uncharacterized protein n=1 Tax=Hevea brasiliensis TaxID=3981 RepID=A0A6A6LWQ5_HEVBR|nr:hypothetical protein GH714_005158 [Hevea brasiliensis]